MSKTMKIKKNKKKTFSSYPTRPLNELSGRGAKKTIGMGRNARPQPKVPEAPTPIGKVVGKVSKPSEGGRLDKVLQIWTGLSRKKVKAAIDQGLVFVNNRKVIIASWELKKGDEVTMVESGTVSPISAENYFLKVVYEDNDILVVEKDAGVLCEPSPQSTKPTLIAIINEYFKRRYPLLKGHYLGLVHRLDRDTSGVMVYSRTKEANRITDQFKQHTIDRRYYALVEGQVEKEQGRIQSYLKKSDLLKGGRKVSVATQESGEKAVTEYRVVERYPHATLVDIKLDTGKTHQIRVQMASIGHPVIGDTVYRDGPSQFNFSRQALHAYYLKFRHPITQKKMEFEVELPKDLKKLIASMRRNS